MNSTGRNSSVLVALAALAALVFAVFPKPGSSPESTKPDKDKKASLAEAPPDDSLGEGPLTPVRSFLGAGKPSRESAAEPGNSGWSVERRLSLGIGRLHLTEEKRNVDPEERFYEWPEVAVLRDCRFRFLLATVPDPADSGFAYMFDQVLESLQRLEQGHYVFDRAWLLPWQRSPSDKSPDRRLRERHPGMILFRSTEGGSDGTHHLLALLLVGETPTSGIHKGAFANAVRLIHHCPARKEEGDPVELRVIGPYFSGSAVSLRLALEDARSTMMPQALKAGCGMGYKAIDRGREPLIKVVCGSASGFNHEEFVRSEWAGLNFETTKAFQTTILPDRVLLQCLRKYLGDPADPTHAEPPLSIGLLCESDTGFGQHIASDLHDRPLSAQEHGPPDFFLVPYPLHISQLRTSYTKEQLARLESQGLPHAVRNLPFPAEGENKEGQGREAIQAQAPLLTTALNDLVLNNLVTTMAQRRGKYICLVSTDPQDKIFLARLIRNRYPDVQLATVGSNLLYTHEEYNTALRGMVVASTYPLHPTVQGWSKPKGKKTTDLRVLFADQNFEGCYNAVLVHLAGAKVDASLSGQLLDYGWEGKPDDNDHTYPPIWISVVGANGQLIPVTHFSPTEYLQVDEGTLAHVFPGDKPPHDANFARFRPPTLSFLLFLVLLIVNGYFFRLVWHYVQESPWHSTTEGLCSRYKQRFDFGVVCLAQILLFGQVAEWGWTPLHHSLPSDFLVKLATLSLLLLSLGMMILAWILLLLAHLREPSNPPESRWARYWRVAWESAPLWLLGEPKGQGDGWRRRGQDFLKRQIWTHGGFWIVLADAAMFLLVTFALLWFLCLNGRAACCGSDVEGVIKFERLAHLSNGVSPLLPWGLFCAALFGWGYCLVKKLYLASHHAVGSPFPQGVSPMFDDLRRLDADVRNELVPPSTLRLHFGKCVGVFVLTAVTVLTLWEDAIPPLDGKWFGNLTLLGFGLGAFLLLFTLLQFYSAWRTLRKMLRFLALLPMQGAFGRLNEKVLSQFGHHLFSLRPRHSHLAISVQQFYLLRRLFPAFRRAVEYGSRSFEQHPPLDAETLTTVCAAVRQAFPEAEFGPPVAQDFENELNAAREEEFEPPPPPNRESPPPNVEPPKTKTKTNVEPPTEWGAQTGADCRELAERCLRVLCRLWPTQPPEAAFGSSPSTGEAATRPAFLSLPEDDPIRLWAVAAEDFVAAEVIRYLAIASSRC